MSEIAIGIDLGTSNSCVAVLRGGKVEVLPNAYGEPITASVVNVTEIPRYWPSVSLRS